MQISTNTFKFRCRHHDCDLVGDPFMIADPPGFWSIDLSDMYCPKLPYPPITPNQEYDAEEDKCHKSWAIEEHPDPYPVKEEAKS